MTETRFFSQVFLIQKADKGNSVVIVEKDVYLRHMETIICNHNMFEKVSIKKGF